MRWFGIALIVIGSLMTIVTGFNVVTKKEVADIGPVEINKEEKTPIYWSPWTGGLLVIEGVIIAVVSRRRG